jgi:hypothetical protein
MLRSPCVVLILLVAGLGVASGQTTLNGDVNITGMPGVFYLDFDISQPCPVATTSSPGRALLCGNGNSVVLSVNGEQPFTLQGGTQPGPQGPPGQAASVTVGTVTTLPSGSAATVTNSGTANAAVFNFGIPEGGSGNSSTPSASFLTADYALVTHGLGPEGPSLWALPGAVTELFGDLVRVQADLTGAGCARLYAQIGENYGPVGAVMYFQFSLDGGVTWDRLTQNADISTSGAHVSVWKQVPGAARHDVLVRAVADNGINTNVEIKAVHLQVGACLGTTLRSQSAMRPSPGQPRIEPPRQLGTGRLQR